MSGLRRLGDGLRLGDLTEKANAAAIGISPRANDLGSGWMGIIPDGVDAKEALSILEQAIFNGGISAPGAFEYEAEEGQSEFVLPFTMNSPPVVFHAGVRLALSDYAWSGNTVTLDTPSLGPNDDDDPDVVTIIAADNALLPHTTIDRVSGLRDELDRSLPAIAAYPQPSTFVADTSGVTDGNAFWQDIAARCAARDTGVVLTGAGVSLSEKITIPTVGRRQITIHAPNNKVAINLLNVNAGLRFTDEYHNDIDQRPFVDINNLEFISQVNGVTDALHLDFKYVFNVLPQCARLTNLTFRAQQAALSHKFLRALRLTNVIGASINNFRAWNNDPAGDPANILAGSSGIVFEGFCVKSTVNDAMATWFNHGLLQGAPALFTGLNFSSPPTYPGSGAIITQSATGASGIAVVGSQYGYYLVMAEVAGTFDNSPIQISGSGPTYTPSANGLIAVPGEGVYVADHEFAFNKVGIAVDWTAPAGYPQPRGLLTRIGKGHFQNYERDVRLIWQTDPSVINAEFLTPVVGVTNVEMSYCNFPRVQNNSMLEDRDGTIGVSVANCLAPVVTNNTMAYRQYGIHDVIGNTALVTSPNQFFDCTENVHTGA